MRPVALVGAGSPAGRALESLLRAEGSLALACERASAEEIFDALEAAAGAHHEVAPGARDAHDELNGAGSPAAARAGERPRSPAGTAVLAMQAGESRELAWALGARGVAVVDLGPDLRMAQVACGFFEAQARGRRLVALPSPAAMAAWTAIAGVLEAGLVHLDRLAVILVEGGADSLSLRAPAPSLADELQWLFGQHGLPPQRLTVSHVGTPGAGLLALVQAEPAREQDEGALRRAVAGPAWLRVCRDRDEPDASRLLQTGEAEVSVSSDGFAERITLACALDPAWFTAHAALRAVCAQRENRTAAG